MNPAPPSGGSSRLPFRCLSLDLEVGRRNSRIRAFAGVRSDTGQTVIFPSTGAALATALFRLDDLADSAEFVLGHNMIAYDLPQLQAVRPGPAAVAEANDRHAQTQSTGLPPATPTTP